MNRKGFTLVELIAVITIMSLIAIITTPAYDSISKSIKTRNYESKKNTIKAHTLSYVEKYLKNEVYDGTSTGTKSKTLCFSVNYLIRNGIISSDSETDEYIENNVTGEKYRNEIFIKVIYDTTNLKLVGIVKDDEEIKYSSGNIIVHSFDNASYTCGSEYK